jgi:RNA polymerase sigma-70 factor (ECF subfamily)
MMDEGTDEQDRQDMRRLAAGHDPALNALMERHSTRLHHFLLRLLQNETQAADLAEEAFVRVYQHRGRFNPAHRFSPWLYTIAANLARDEQRYRARHPNVPLETPAAEGGQDFRELLPETRPGPAQAVQAAERVAAVRAAVAALPEDLRAPLILSEYEEKSHAEIGTILNCSAKAVEMRLYRARQHLRERLAEWVE